MTTIVNTPPATNESGNNIGLIVGGIALVVVIYLFFLYGLPALRNVQTGAPQINVPTQIIVPDEVDVNINQAK